MPNEPLGISFSPFAQQPNGASPTGYNPSVPATPQDAVRILSLRLPRVLGAAAPVPQALLASPGSAAIGAGMFGQAGGNLDQLMALLFGPNRRLFPGGSASFNERPAQGDRGLGGMFGFGGGPESVSAADASSLPWERPSAPLPGFTYSNPPATPREGDANVPPASGAPLPWETGPAATAGENRDRLRY